MIEGVIIKKLSQILDDRGRVMHMLRADDPLFKKFGEIYFSEILPGVVKAWKLHKKTTQRLAVPIGKIRLVIYDSRENSKSKGELTVIEIGRENYNLIQIPPELWYGFRCLGDYPALIANCLDLPYSPHESDSIKTDDSAVPYQW